MKPNHLFKRFVILSIITLIIGFVLAFLLLTARQSNPTAATPTISSLKPIPSPMVTPIPVAVSPLPTPTDLPAPTAVAVSPLPAPTATQASTTPVYTYKIVNTFPHDRGAFTQGLVFTDGVLYEGTGLYGQSTLRRVTLETGQPTQVYALPLNFFGEGITIFGDKIFQLTWKEHTGFIYAKDTFAPAGAFTYPTEGWGLTQDGARLIMSDGSANLYFLNPTTLAETGRVEVHDENGPVVRLNELEYINGEVYANIWQTDRIARIDPSTGRVLAWLDMSGLLTPADRSQPVDVLNGIAYDALGGRLFVTGKLWPKLFEIVLVAPTQVP